MITVNTGNVKRGDEGGITGLFHGLEAQTAKQQRPDGLSYLPRLATKA